MPKYSNTNNSTLFKKPNGMQKKIGLNKIPELLQIADKTLAPPYRKIDLPLAALALLNENPNLKDQETMGFKIELGIIMQDTNPRCKSP